MTEQKIPTDEAVENFAKENEDLFRDYDPYGNGYALDDPKGWYLDGGNELG